jgi:hypothetical protein
MKPIGATFGDELKAAGVDLNGVAWADTGEITFAESVSNDTRAAVALIYASHDPERFDGKPILDQLRPVRDMAVLKLGGIARKADKQGNTVISDACDAAIDALLALPTAPSVTGATTKVGFVQALKDEWSGIVTSAKAASPELVKAFGAFDA